MAQQELSIPIQSVEGMTRLGRDLACLLAPGRVIALHGPIGAGKSALCRAIIQASLTVPEDVPSPTFTLVQTYDAHDFEIWHCDLYRLNSLDQVDELGLWDAMDSAACLIEWPELLGDTLPLHTMKIHISTQDQTDHRIVTLSMPSPPWPNLKEVLHDTY